MGTSAGLAGSTSNVADKPFKQRIIDDIREKIRTGELLPGAQLPSIAELCVQYETSTTPVKAALDWLDATGYIRKHHGKGTFVADNPPADA